MTATHSTTRRTRKTPARPARRRRLPRLGWGAAALTLFCLYIAVRTWPIQASIIAAALAAAAILRAIRPQRLARLWTGLDRIAAHRRTLPRNGARTLDTFHRLTPAGFEQAITELALEDPAVHTATRVGQANDRGADVLVHMRDGRRILVQCKQYRPGNNVGSETIQTINGVYRDLHHCHQAVIVTTSGYTRPALDTNAMLHHPIRLIDGPQLAAWANGGTPPWA